MAGDAVKTKAAKITDNAAGQGEGIARGTDQRNGRSARSDLPVPIYGNGGNIQTNLKEFTEQLVLILRNNSGVELVDAFNCVRLGEYFTCKGERYRED
jgi:hypothetical protein